MQEKPGREPLFPASNVVIVVLLILFLLGAGTVYASDTLDLVGYLSFRYGLLVKREPTATESQSKVWWHDRHWWGVLYNPRTEAYHIYRLRRLTQEWIDTGVVVDDREESRSDVLWDEVSGKLYVASHIKVENPTPTPQFEQWARLYRFSYDRSSRRYVLDGGFPATINRDVVESVVLDKDSSGRLWATYVSRPDSQSSEYQVYVHYTNGSDTAWSAPFVLPFEEARVDVDDISTLVAFEDDTGPKIGVMWSNQRDGNFYFATHDDRVTPFEGWSLEPAGLSIGFPADDHIRLVSAGKGRLLAAVKTETLQSGDVLIGVAARDRDGTFSFHPVSPVGSVDTAPILVVHEHQERLYVFTVSKTHGGQVCMVWAPIPERLADMELPYANCPDEVGEDGIDGSQPSVFLSSTVFSNIHNPTTSKQMANWASGIIVVASDDLSGGVYVHNYLPTTSRNEEIVPAMRRAPWLQYRR
jgi:hypothetical protein